VWFNAEAARACAVWNHDERRAAELRRSPLTIKTQLAAVFGKLGVRGRTRVAARLNR